METSLNKIMPANINRRLFDGSSAIDMVVSDAGTLKCFDQSIIMIGRGDDKTTCLSARRNAKIKKYEAALKLGSIQFAPIIVSLLGAEDDSFGNFFEYCSTVAKNNGNNFSAKFYIARISHLLATKIGIRTAMCYFNTRCHKIKI